MNVSGATLERVAEKMLTVDEVADAMRVNPETVRRWIRSGQLRGVRMATGRGGGAYKIPESELVRLQQGQ